MKKFLLTILLILAVLVSCACDSVSIGSTLAPPVTPVPTATPAPVVSRDALTQYTIVYPAEYNHYRMEDVEYLQRAMKAFCGADIDAISDEEEYDGKRIILASGASEHAYTDKIKEYNRTLSYIIAVDDAENIVIGGANYYSDMLAIYEFARSWLNYSEDNETTREYAISGCKEYTWTQIQVATTACALNADAFAKKSHFDDLVSAGFNSVVIDANNYTKRQMHNLVRWCAMNNVNVVMRSLLYTDIYWDCPVVRGHLIVDEPYGVISYEYYSEECKKYMMSFESLGWQPYVNLLGQEGVISLLNRDTDLFGNVTDIAYKVNTKNANTVINVYAKIAEYSQKTGKVFIGCAGAKDALEGYTAKEALQFTAYASMCFDANGIQFFCYADEDDGDSVYGTLVDEHFEHLDAWQYAEKINSNVHEIARLTEGYTYNGTEYFYGTGGVLVYGTPMYNETFVKDITTAFDTMQSKLLVACYINKENNDRLYIVLNYASQSEGYGQLSFGINAKEAIVWSSNTGEQKVLKNKETFTVNSAECAVIRVPNEVRSVELHVENTEYRTEDVQ